MDCDYSNEEYHYKKETCDKFILNIFNELTEINKKLFEFGIIIKQIIENDKIYIKFDFEKIDKDSFIIKNNIIECYIIINDESTYYYYPCIMFIINNVNKFINIKSDCVIKSILIELFKFIGINLFDRYENYDLVNIDIDTDIIMNDLKDHKNYDKFRVRLQTLTQYESVIDKNLKWKEENIDIIKEYTDEFFKLTEGGGQEDLTDSEIKIKKFLQCMFTLKYKTKDLLKDPKNKEIFSNLLQTIDTTTHNMLDDDIINKMDTKIKIKEFFEDAEHKIYEIVIFKFSTHDILYSEIVDFEKKLFIEIFNLETTESDIPVNIDLYNKKYLYLLNKLKRYMLFSHHEFEIIKENIKNLLRFINSAFY